jgi:UPF0271 protein
MAPTRTVDLNADVGEATEQEAIARERELIGLATSINVACGAHAGDEVSMTETVVAALNAAVRVGAHPSYPDREGFGRRPMRMPGPELRSVVGDQLRALGQVCARAGTTVESVKPHGALYEEVAKGGLVYEAVRDAVRDACGPDTALVLPSGCRALAMVLRDVMPARAEGFCDRAYRPDGGLVDRATPGAVLTDPGAAAAQALGLARGAVVASDGCVLTLWVDTLCVHGDSPEAVAIATAVRAALEDAGIDLAAPARP